MIFKNQCAVVICASLLFSFLFGVITEKYKTSPIAFLRAINKFVSPDSTPTPSHSDYFYDRKSFFEEHGGHQYDVVFIGDSITDAAEWEDLFPSQKIANRGINGDSTDGVLERMDSIYSTNARKVFIMIGINDLASGGEVHDIVENYKRIINNLVAHEMQTYVQSTLLAGNQKAELNKKIMILNDQLKRMAEESNLFTYIDLNAGLAKGSALESKYTRDGVHLNGKGYAVWKDTLKKYIQ